MSITLNAKTIIITLVVVNVIYGVITHYHSLAQIREVKKKCEKNEEDIYSTHVKFCDACRITELNIMAIFFWRITLQFACRIFFIIVGIIATIFVGIGTGNFRTCTFIIQNGWHWHYSAKKIASALRGWARRKK